jgi:hypothetical protein
MNVRGLMWLTKLLDEAFYLLYMPDGVITITSNILI